MEEVFRRVFIELLGRIPDDKDLRDSKACLKSSKDETEIRRYVATLPLFRDRYTDIIKRVYEINNIDQPDEATMTVVLRRFTDPEYGVDDLAEDITSGNLGSESKSEPDNIKPPSAALPSSNAMMEFAREWKAACGKKIDVYEFIRYFPDRPDKQTIKRLVEDQETAMLFVDRAHKDFLGRGVTRDEFLEGFLTDHDKPHFEAEVIATVLESEEYRAQMSAKLNETNKKLYGVALHPDDLEFIFDKIQCKRTMLNSEEVNDELIHANDELREISEAVNKTYHRILNRTADNEEVRDCVHTFRAYGAEFAVGELATRLHNSLEFQDVIKEKIRAAHKKKHGRDPRAKELYDSLASLIHKYASDMKSVVKEFE